MHAPHAKYERLWRAISSTQTAGPAISSMPHARWRVLHSCGASDAGAPGPDLRRQLGAQRRCQLRGQFSAHAGAQLVRELRAHVVAQLAAQPLGVRLARAGLRLTASACGRAEGLM